MPKNKMTVDDPQKWMDAAVGPILEGLGITNLRLTTGKLRKMLVALAPLISLDPTGELEVRSKNYQPTPKNAYVSGRKLRAPLNTATSKEASLKKGSLVARGMEIYRKATEPIDHVRLGEVLCISKKGAANVVSQLYNRRLLKKIPIRDCGRSGPRFQYKAVG